jgi:hypothetical protein
MLSTGVDATICRGQNGWRKTRPDSRRSLGISWGPYRTELLTVGPLFNTMPMDQHAVLLRAIYGTGHT